MVTSSPAVTGSASRPAYAQTTLNVGCLTSNSFVGYVCNAWMIAAECNILNTLTDRHHWCLLIPIWKLEIILMGKDVCNLHSLCIIVKWEARQVMFCVHTVAYAECHYMHIECGASRACIEWMKCL